MIQVGDQQVIIGDVLQELIKLSKELIDCTVTSPPYNRKIKYNSYEDNKERTDYLFWMEEVAKELFRVTKDEGSVFVNLGNSNSDPWLASDVAKMFGKFFILQNNILWVKSFSFEEDTLGHFKPINSQRYINNCYEHIFHFTKTGNVILDRLAVGVPFKDKSNILRRSHAQDKRCAGNVFFIPYETVRSKEQKFNHPAGFPVELPKRCILLHGKPNMTVLDPFLGVGSTLCAAKALGHHGIGIEIDPVYANLAIERLTKMTEGNE